MRAIGLLHRVLKLALIPVGAELGLAKAPEPSRNVVVANTANSEL